MSGSSETLFCCSFHKVSQRKKERDSNKVTPRFYTPQIIFLLYFFFIIPNKCSLYLFDLFSCVSWNLCFKCRFSTGAIYAVQLYSSIVSRCFYLLHHPRAVTAGSSATWGGGATNYYASCLANYLLHMQTQKITCTKRHCTNNFGMCEALVSAGCGKFNRRMQCC